MKKKPFFSIIIPTYNRATELEFALFCIFRQEYYNYEVVILDNCSTDNTKEVVRKFSNNKIHYYKNKKNLSMIDNQKKAVKYAKGEYIFMHSDDDFLLYKDTLRIVHNVIKRNKVGYIRLNYISLTIDKKRVFNYKVYKLFNKNYFFPPLSNNKKVVDFIVNSDPYFITGIILKNNLSKSTQIINADPAPWINMLYYNTKKYGGYFISKPHIVASWSRREIKKINEHHFYSLKDGKLRAENFFVEVEKKLSKKDYKVFLRDQLIIIYIHLLPVIKVLVGNKKMLAVCKRIQYLDPSINKTVIYWIYFLPTFLIPRFLLKHVRDISLYIYTQVSRVKDNKVIIDNIKNLTIEYEKNNSQTVKNFSKI